MVYKTMKCLTCKVKLGNPKFCSPKCQKEAGKRFDRIIGNLKTEKRPWGISFVAKVMMKWYNQIICASFVQSYWNWMVIVMDVGVMWGLL